MYVVNVRNTVVLDNTCGVARGDKNIYDSTFYGNDVALCGTGNVNLYNCMVYDNVVGLDLMREATIENCVIENNERAGIITSCGALDIHGCSIVNNGIGVIFLEAADYFPEGLYQNTICGNAEYDIEMETSADLDVTNNWWCTTDAEGISSRIYDIFDNENLGRVEFEPFLMEAP